MLAKCTVQSVYNRERFTLIKITSVILTLTVIEITEGGQVVKVKITEVIFMSVKRSHPSCI